MRYRTVLVLVTPILLTGALTLTAAADTAPPPVLYVNNLANYNCDDTGPGTLAEPFCTIQHAADVVQPGQTVIVGPKVLGAVYHEDVHITRSGTPGQPITFESGAPWQNGEPATSVGTADSNRTEPNGFVLDNVHDVTIDGFEVYEPTSTGIVVSNSSDITINHVAVSPQIYLPVPPDAIDVSGNSSNVAITRSNVSSFQGTAIGVEPGTSGVTVAENMLGGSNYDVVVNGAANTAITNNTAPSQTSYCQPGVFQGHFVVEGGSTGTSIQNNILLGGCTNQTPMIAVAADSVTATVADYNVVNDSTDTAIYSWAGTPYPTAAKLYAATGQGAHDSNARQNPGKNGAPAERSPAVDSANANAPGVLPTDYWGNARVDDPNDPNTGTGIGYIDRGAVELEDPMTVADTVNGTNYLQAPAGGTVSLAMSTKQNWSPTAQYTVDFGDGTAPVATTSSTVTHVYATPSSQRYPISITATDQLGNSATGTDSVLVVPPAPLIPAITVTSTGALAASVVASNSTDSWTMTDVTYDFGDGSAPQDTGVGVYCPHNYATAGTYTITATVSDAGGNSQSTTTQFVAS